MIKNNTKETTNNTKEIKNGANEKTIHIAFGSESGNAHGLANALKKKLQLFNPTISTLDELSLTEMTSWSNNDYLLIITSTTGNGEAPYNANNFYQALIQKRMKQRMKADKSTIDCSYAVFGLGNVMYENFCGFSIVVDGMFDKIGAKPIVKRVDADVDYEEFFEEWSDALLSYFLMNQGAEKVLNDLDLQVIPD